MPTQYGPGAMGSAEAGNVIAEQQSAPDNTAPRDPATSALGFLLRDWRPIDNAGALVGRATVELPGVGLHISDIAIFVGKDGNRWSQLPAELQRDRDGQPLRDDRGKPKYRSALRWRDRDLQERFSRALIQAIEQRHGPLAGGS